MPFNRVLDVRPAQFEIFDNQRIIGIIEDDDFIGSIGPVDARTVLTYTKFRREQLRFQRLSIRDKQMPADNRDEVVARTLPVMNKRLKLAAHPYITYRPKADVGLNRLILENQHTLDKAVSRAQHSAACRDVDTGRILIRLYAVRQVPRILAEAPVHCAVINVGHSYLIATPKQDIFIDIACTRTVVMLPPLYASRACPITVCLLFEGTVTYCILPW